MTKLHDLHAVGQSVWLDFIRRDLLRSGELDRLVTEGVRGLTSNPTIFQQAIAGSEEYDDQIRSIIASDASTPTEAVFEELAVADIAGAADALRGVYDAADGADGFVSLEVSPHLAHDTDATVSEALRLWRWVDRPNLMIKVPATPAGIPAIEELIAAGLNINVTLLFALDNYIEVAHAYLRGLARADDPARVASVASFFVSRVDSKTDAALEKIGSEEAMALMGKAAVANAKLAYRHFRSIFGSDAFAEQQTRGARPQRVLWASTSTKNPAYPDVLYVDTLVGSETVNTMPPATIDAFRDHGVVDGDALDSGLDAADDEMAAIAALGVDIDEITRELQDEGVKKFADSFDDLLATLSDKIEALR
ncbi:MAG: transaldolase [Acidimicrobiia bacterium]